MIVQEAGRWRSTVTPAEFTQQATAQVADLSQEEQAALQLVLQQWDQLGYSPLAQTAAEVEWDEQPLPVAEWLASEDHVGETGQDMYSVLQGDLIDLFEGDHHEALLCLHPDTRVPLLDGSTLTIAELAARWEAKPEPFWVYSRVGDSIVPRRAECPRKTGVDDYYRVTLDDGSTFTGNARHQMIMRDGSKRMIRDMAPGDSLTPFDVRLSSLESGDNLKGYEQIHSLDGEWVYTHRSVARTLCERESPSCSVVHHADFNKRNNTPENLQWMRWHDHTMLHARLAHREWRTDITLEAIGQAAQASLRETAEVLQCSCSRVRRVLANHGATGREYFGDRRGRRRGKDDVTISEIRCVIAAGAKTACDVAVALSRTKSTIYRALKTEGLTWADVASKSRRQTWKVTAAQIRQAVADGSFTQAAVAERLACSVSAIRGVLQREDISWRTLCETGDNHYVVTIEKIGYGPVFCLTVPGAGNFAIATDRKEEIQPDRRSGVFSSNTGAIGWG